jgi:hypothetical protein
MKPCTICNDPRCSEMEEAINNGGTIRATARLYNVSHDALQRHNNLHTGVRDTTHEPVVSEEFDTLKEIDSLYRKNKAVLDACKNPTHATKLIEQQVKLLDMREKALAKKETDNHTHQIEGYQGFVPIDPNKLDKNTLMGLVEYFDKINPRVLIEEPET